MNDDKLFGDRIALIMKHYGLNKNSISVKVGLQGNSVIGRVVNDPTRSLSLDVTKELCQAFPELNVRWLVTGEGAMLGKETASYEKGEIRYYKLEAGEPFPEEIKHIRATAKMSIPGFKDCEFAFDVFGDSMSPRFRHTDVILCVDHSKLPIQLGEPYLIVHSGKQLIRIVKSGIGEAALKLVSVNPLFEEIEIDRSAISHLYLIKGIIRREVY
jgi:hypothetical protein